MYGVPGKGVTGGGALAATGAAYGSWAVAGAGLAVLGAFLVFLSMRVGRA